MLDKSIISGKEHRKQYRGAKAVDYTCRNHGSCSYCLNSRMYSTNKRIESFKYELENFLNTVQWESKYN